MAPENYLINYSRILHYLDTPIFEFKIKDCNIYRNKF